MRLEELQRAVEQLRLALELAVGKLELAVGDVELCLKVVVYLTFVACRQLSSAAARLALSHYGRVQLRAAYSSSTNGRCSTDGAPAVPARTSHRPLSRRPPLSQRGAHR